LRNTDDIAAWVWKY